MKVKTLCRKALCCLLWNGPRMSSKREFQVRHNRRLQPWKKWFMIDPPSLLYDGWKTWRAAHWRAAHWRAALSGHLTFTRSNHSIFTQQYQLTCLLWRLWISSELLLCWRIHFAWPLTLLSHLSLILPFPAGFWNVSCRFMPGLPVSQARYFCTPLYNSQL